MTEGLYGTDEEGTERTAQEHSTVNSEKYKITVWSHKRHHCEDGTVKRLNCAVTNFVE